MNILIFGSCVSRDILNFDENNDISLASYYARSSFASAFHQDVVMDIYSENITSAFQRRMVQADLSKSFPMDLAKLSFDQILVDLIDERFDLFAFHSGGVCTLSNEFISSGFECRDDLGRRIKSGSEEFFTLWERGWSRFVEILNNLGKLETVRVNRVFWAERTSDGGNFFPHYSDDRVQQANEFLKRLYARMALDIQHAQFLDFDKNIMIGATEHRWGLSPFHYIDDYYRYAMKRLIEANRCMPDLLSDRVLEEWNEFSFGNNDVDLKSISGNAVLKSNQNHIEAGFKGEAGAYQFRFKLPNSILSNGVSARFRLRGWEAVRYVAIGYTHENTFRHVKITNAARGNWIDFSIGHHDIAYGLQNNWESPAVEQIEDIRLYINGTPSADGANLDVEKLWCWREKEQNNTVMPLELTPVSSELLSVIYDYLHKCFRTVEEQAQQFLKEGACPLYGEVMLNWSANSPLPDELATVGTYQFSWHALHPATILMLYARSSGTAAPLYAARELVTNWLERSYFQVDENKKFAWYDHGTAERLIAMILMWSVGVEQKFDARFMTRLKSAIFRHAQLLDSELFYASHQPTRYHNHAWFQDIALMATALAMPDFPSAKRWLETALSRLTDQLDTLIVRDNGFAVFVENSIGYHQGVQRIVEFAGNLVALTSRNSHIPDVARELAEFSKFLRYPDNRSPAQGDTFRRSNIAEGGVRISRPYEKTVCAILPNAGYGIVKGNNDGASFMFTVLATSLCRTHKHEDNLSFTLFFDGIEWLIDPSFYSHEYSAPIPAYLRSASAHNALAIPSLDYCIDPRMAKFEGKSSDSEFLFCGEHYAYKDTLIKRNISGRLDCLELDFVDIAINQSQHQSSDLCLMLHCGERVEAKLDNKTLILSHPDSAFQLMLNLPTDFCHISFNETATEPIRGIAGLGFMQHIAVNTITCKVPFNEFLKWNLRALRK